MTSSEMTLPAIAIALVLLGCGANVVFLELLVKEDPGCGNLVTFASFLFIAIEGFIFTTKCGTVGPKVPFRSWTTLVIMYFVVSVTNNYALNFNISMPLHMIFRAGSLMANMVLGIIVLGKRYNFTKYFSVVMITLGIAVCTVISGQSVKNHSPVDKDDSLTGDIPVEHEEDPWEFFNWLIGISMLTFALFLSAQMGIYQEIIYKRHGKHPQEALFYSHLLPLPGFLLLGQNIYEHFLLAMNSAPLTLAGTSIQLPSMIVYLALNVITQFICISAVFILTSECASLTVTLVVTLRKFLSLLFSIWYFQNPFTATHWMGTFLVFAGTLLFSDVHGMIWQKIAVSKTKKEQ